MNNKNLFSKRFIPFFSLFLLNSIAVVLIAIICSIWPHTVKAQSLLSEPQKIVIDAKRNRLLVSNFATGDIVAIDSAGNQSYFKRNAGFVDGMEIVGDTIYGVGKLRRFLAYNLADTQLVMDTTFAGASGNYLSSVAYDSSGHLFISCPKLHTIYKMRISDRSYWVFAQNNGLNKPNGILLEKERNRIVVIGDVANASIYAVSLADSSVSTLMTTTLFSPDGIVRDKFGNHYISGYYETGLFRTDPDFTQAPQMFFSGNSMVYPTYDPSDHSLLVTHYNMNSWERIPLPSIGIDQEKKSKHYNLFQNYPNPFNPSTTIYYELPENSHVQLKIFNILGQELNTLVNGFESAGLKQVMWNGKDQKGIPAAAGVYIYQLQIQTKDRKVSQNRKMILVK